MHCQLHYRKWTPSGPQTVLVLMSSVRDEYYYTAATHVNINYAWCVVIIIVYINL